ncbi:MAG: type II toxin-antitoxin system RatA family toxin [Pseudomonadales bacterium]|nr:type II toxin-antitoxin system RatA family toxin [Pseudomonadales bacterium]
MPKINRNILLPFSADQIYDLVYDIEKYPDFMSGCSAARVISEEPTEVVAELRLGKGALNVAFVTKNQVCRPEYIRMALVSGPFKKLKGGWEISHIDEQACKISFNIEFTLSNRLAEVAMKRMLSSTADDLISSIGQQARKLYGNQ